MNRMRQEDCLLLKGWSVKSRKVLVKVDCDSDMELDVTPTRVEIQADYALHALSSASRMLI